MYIIYIYSPNQSALCLQRDGRNISIPIDERNADYREYLAWVAEGNEAQVIDFSAPSLPPTPSIEERLEAAEALIDMMLEAGGEASNG
jgi:hypothetical protein